MTLREFNEAYEGWEWLREQNMRVLGMAIGNNISIHVKRNKRKRLVRGLVKAFAELVSGSDEKVSVDLMKIEDPKERKRLFLEKQKARKERAEVRKRREDLQRRRLMDGY